MGGTSTCGAFLQPLQNIPSVQPRGCKASWGHRCKCIQLPAQEETVRVQWEQCQRELGTLQPVVSCWSSGKMQDIDSAEVLAVSRELGAVHSWHWCGSSGKRVGCDLAVLGKAGCPCWPWTVARLMLRGGWVRPRLWWELGVYWGLGIVLCGTIGLGLGGEGVLMVIVVLPGVGGVCS